MKVKVFTTDDDGGIHFSKQELQALLDEVYREGYDDGRAKGNWTWTSPYITTTNPVITYATNSTSCTSTSNITAYNCVEHTGDTLTATYASAEPYQVEFISKN